MLIHIIDRFVIQELPAQILQSGVIIAVKNQIGGMTMSIDEAIERCETLSTKGHIIFSRDPDIAEECNEKYKQLAEWLEELKELRAYKEKMEMQYIDDIDNPLEPLKLQSALESEIFKFNYRKEHKPQDINILDYTVMYALKHCLEEQLKAGGKDE